MQINIAICDDEQMQVQINARYIKEIAERNQYDLAVTGFTTLSTLQSYISSHPVDIVFMDIDLGSTSGIKGAIDLFQSCPDLIVIFVTAHREFAYEAFDMEATGYLLKPVDPAKLQYTLQKAIAQLEGNRKEPAMRFHTFIVDKNPIRIPESEILYAERVLSHVQITTTTDSYRIYDSITSLSKKLGDGFIRISQSTLVSIAEISDIRNYTLYTKHGEEKTISRKNRKEVLQAFFH